MIDFLPKQQISHLSFLLIVLSMHLMRQWRWQSPCWSVWTFPSTKSVHHFWIQPHQDSQHRDSQSLWEDMTKNLWAPPWGQSLTSETSRARASTLHVSLDIPNLQTSIKMVPLTKSIIVLLSPSSLFSAPHSPHKSYTRLISCAWFITVTFPVLSTNIV